MHNPAKHFQLELQVLLRSFGSVFAVQIANALLQLSTVAVIARLWGPQGNGVYVVSLLLPTMLASLLNMGVNIANVYYLGGRMVSPRAALAFSLRLNALLGAVGLVAGGALIHFEAGRLFPGIEPRVLWVALASFPVILMLGFMQSILQGLQRFRDLNVSLLFQPLVALACIVLARLAGVDDLALLVGANLAGACAALAYALRLVRGQPSAAEAGDAAYPRSALGYGYKAYLSNLLTLVQARADTFLINMLISPAAAGVYAIAFQVGEKLWMLSQAVSTVLLPRLSELANDEQRRIHITTVVSRLVLAISAIGALAFAVLGYPLIQLVFGPRYADSYLPFLIMLPGMVALTAARVIANDIAARGRPELNLYMAAAGVVITVSGNLLVLPYYGIKGAAAVTTLAYVADLGLKMLVYRAMTDAAFMSPVLVRISDFSDALTALRLRPGPAAQDHG